MTFSKIMRFLVPASLIFAFSAPAFADGSAARIRPAVARTLIAHGVAKKASSHKPAVVKPGAAKPATVKPGAAARPRLPIQKNVALPRR